MQSYSSQNLGIKISIQKRDAHMNTWKQWESVGALLLEMCVYLR